MGYPLIIRTDRKSQFARLLLAWYLKHRRDLPWRRTGDPYRIWVSEIMLQQTRVEVVLPYYERFLAKYPDVASVANAPEQELLSMWAGLGYYSRARNMRRAARLMSGNGGFPRTYDAIRALPGVGAYTAAAIASIAFGLPHAVLDGNVIRVMARITGDASDIRLARTRARLQAAAESRLDTKDPGTFNQALMELGATVCTPTDPKCLSCPVERLCEARAAGREREFPIKSARPGRTTVSVTLLIVLRDKALLLWQRPMDSGRLAEFWELPEPHMLPGAELRDCVGHFRHSITNTTYTITVRLARVRAPADGFEFVDAARLPGLPLSTTARKAIAAWENSQNFCTFGEYRNINLF